MIRTVEPDLVCTLYTATFGDCLFHLFARARDIRSFDLQQSRLQNYVMFVDGINEPPPHFVRTYQNLQNGVPEALEKEAERIIRSVLDKQPMYEGVLLAAEKKKNLFPQSTGKGRGDGSKLGWIIGFIRQQRKLKKPPYCHDHQNPGIFKPVLYRKVLNPLRAKRIRGKLAESFVSRDALSRLSYVFFPLHVEPELVLSQFARPCLNQIEVVRNISLSMPVGMPLLVKEHPMMIGRRSIGYYEKILEIPNVKLVDWDLSSDTVLDHAQMVVIIRGAIGLEAAIRRIPVVSLGKSFFQVLPQTMFRTCWNLYELPSTIQGMLTDYRYDHDAMVRYIAAVIQSSVAVNLLEMIGKTKRGYHRMISEERGSLAKDSHLVGLTGYLLERIGEPSNVLDFS
jgi:hypothetical protein